MTAVPNPGWTAERIVELTRLWNLGWSASQVARSLRYVTRNAVIGKVNRLGLTSRAPEVVAEALSLGNRLRNKVPGAPKAPRVAKPKLTQNRTGLTMAPRLQSRPLPAPSLAELTQTVNLDGLNTHACKWPIGDPLSPSFGFCGRLKGLEVSYCPHHVAVAYRPSRPEKARPYVPKRAA